jgi:hypothetical protein
MKTTLTIPVRVVFYNSIYEGVAITVLAFSNFLSLWAASVDQTDLIVVFSLPWTVVRTQKVQSLFSSLTNSLQIQASSNCENNSKQFICSFISVSIRGHYRAHQTDYKAIIGK